MSLNCALSYSKNIDPLFRTMKTLFTRYSDLLLWTKNNISILDIGIGDGRMAKEVLIPSIPKKFREYVGCDISRSALEHSRTIMKSTSFKTLEMDIATSELPAKIENRFDNVVSTFCFHNVKNTSLAFRNIYQTLKPGGQFLICTFEETPIDSVYTTLDKGIWSKYDNWKAYSPFYGTDASKEYNKIIEECGFRDVQIHSEPDCQATFSERALDELYVSVNPRLQHVNEKERNAYIRDYLHALKTGSTVQEVRGECGEKSFKVNLKLIVAVGTKLND